MPDVNTESFIKEISSVMIIGHTCYKLIHVGTVQDSVVNITGLGIAVKQLYMSQRILGLMILWFDRSFPVLITNKAFGQEDVTLYMWSSGVLACHGMPITTCGMAVQVTIIFYSRRGLDYQPPIKNLFIPPFTSVPAFLSPNSKDSILSYTCLCHRVR